MMWVATGFACLFLGLATRHAAAQEEITVEKMRGMTGLWRIEVPRSIHIGLFGETGFGPMRPVFCRIGDAGTIHCLDGGFSREGTVSEGTNGLHIAWGTAMARFVIDGTRDGGAFSGRFALKLSGISLAAPALSTGSRIDGKQSATDGKANALLALLKASGLPELAEYGAAEDAAYLGTAPRLDGRGDPAYFSVYAVEFSDGQRLCGIHADRFTCV